MSVNALIEVIKNQKQIIEQQKAYLSQLDSAVADDQQREIIQLERQQENLRAVLYPLRKNDWPSRLQSERIALLSITASINELKQKLEAIVAEIRQRTDEERELQLSVSAVEEELKQLQEQASSIDDVTLSSVNE